MSSHEPGYLSACDHVSLLLLLLGLEEDFGVKLLVGFTFALIKISLGYLVVQELPLLGDLG